MTTDNVISILKLRASVYLLGVKYGIWQSVDEDNTTEMLKYLYPKSYNLAVYNLLLERMRKHHDDIIPLGEYSLFHLPAQQEEEIHRYLLNNGELCIFNIVKNPQTYIDELNTITCDSVISEVNIGSLRSMELDTLIRIVAFHYNEMFKNGVKSYPYFCA
mgnify:CR=1 FL=1